MKTGYTVADAMTNEPIFVSPDETVSASARTMRENRIGALLIKDGGDVVGIVTEEDFVFKVVAENLDASDVKINDVMTTNLITSSPDKDIFEALTKMRDSNIKHLPILDGNTFVGLLTMADILKLEPQLFDLLVDKLEVRESENKPLAAKSADDEVADIINDSDDE